jgi:energy-coupling factor transporter ATP-binding protein EcfA2
MAATWKNLEEYVRAIASLKWGAPCKPEHLNGVDFDGVVRISDDEIILIEITKERTLQKVRDDLNKIKPSKLQFAIEGVICRGYIILEEEPTLSMDEAGRDSHIKVCSAAEFSRGFFDFQSYDSLRRSFPFGSAVDSRTGANDSREFIHVNYTETEGSKKYKLESIASSLQRGQNIVLTGDFGTGKSRCVREVYELLRSRTRESGAFPLAINLRDHWSSSSALEIIAGHLGNIGIGNSIDNVVRLLNSGNLILLLDGFDEIGTQVHDARIEDRKSLRRRAVQGVRDLITRGKTGILITGRSHFFDSADEMLESLGLSVDSDTHCIEAPDEFSEEEGNKYLQTIGIKSLVPTWLPRKPLVFQLLVELDPQDVGNILNRKHGEYEFWGTFIHAVCRRESNGVGGSIAPQTIHMILHRLASVTRYSNTCNGRLTTSDIDIAYQEVVGSVPDQSGRQLLSRMCTLGRIEPESPDRHFLDLNVLDILRAEALVADVVQMKGAKDQIQWCQSLRHLGAFHAAQTIRFFDLEQHCFSYLKKNSNSRNTKKLGEIVSILSVYGNDLLDFQSLQLSGSVLPVLNLSSRIIKNLVLKDSEIEHLFLGNTPITLEDGVVLDGCIVSNVFGVSDTQGFPAWVTNTEAFTYERISNASRIKESILLPAQKLFLSIIHKIFFQPGGGREEATLLKGGYGQKFSPKLVDSIIKMLLREGVIDKAKGDNGWIYKPIRRYTDRMNKIRSELTLSEDPIWKEASNLRQ